MPGEQFPFGFRSTSSSFRATDSVNMFNTHLRHKETVN